MTPEAKSYLRGKCYHLEKRGDGGHGDQKSGDQNDLPTTAQRLGEAYGVGEATIRRDGEFAEAVDTLEAGSARHHYRYANGEFSRPYRIMES
jgi:hypothetical protein